MAGFLTGAFAVTTPIVTFFFFEVALRITLPKGYTEELFYPLYDWFPVSVRHRGRTRDDRRPGAGLRVAGAGREALPDEPMRLLRPILRVRASR